MAPINFAGKLPVAVVLNWKGDVIANAPTQAFKNFKYVIANEFVTEFTISVGGSSPTVIERKKTKGNKFFDDNLNTFTTAPTPGPELDALIAGGDAVPCTISLTFTLHTFFDAMLTQMTRTDADLHTLANPNDSKAILATFVTSVVGKKINVNYLSKPQTLKDVKCMLVDQSVTPRPGKPPAVKLVFELDFTPVDDVKREAMRKLIAIDWSKLARFGKVVKAGQTSPKNVDVWLENRNTYVVNHLDMVRAENLRSGIVARHTGKSALALVTDLRDDIDLHLITANHWGQQREDLKKEPHQKALSDLFGTLHSDAWLSSPVNLLRTLEDPLKLDEAKMAAVALQFGTGHCGEHATVSFSILKEIIRAPGNLVKRAVRTGNANVDHAFVVYDLDVETVIDTITTNAANSRDGGSGPMKAGSKITVWNLRDAITRNAPREGFVMDPYLDQSVMKPKAADLLTALNRKDRQDIGKDTDFLAFDDEFPTPQSFGRLDFTLLDVARRKRNVKNV